MSIHIPKEKLSRMFRKYPVVLAYLFGSAATGHAIAGSDIDIAVLFSKSTTKERRFDMRLELMTALVKVFKRKTDVIVLNDVASLFFQYIIIKEGSIIFRASEVAQAEFESSVFGRYFDFAPFLSFYNRRYVQRGLQ